MGHMGPTFKKSKIEKNKKKLKIIKGRRTEREREKRERKFLFIYFISFSLTSLFDIRKSDCQNSSGQEAK